MRHPRVAAEPGRGREHRRAVPQATARAARRAARAARVRVVRRRSSRGGALDDAEAAALLLREGGDREVGAALERAAAGRRRGRRRRAAAAPAPPRARRARAPGPFPRRGSRSDACTGGFGLGGGPVARAVVGDDHLGVGKRLAQRGDGRGRSAPPRRARRRGWTAASLSQRGIGGSTPSRAVFLTPYWPPLGAGEQQGEREAARLGVEVVDGGELLLRERLDRGRLRSRHLGAHRRDAWGAEPCVEPGEEAGGHPALRERCSG